MHTHHVEWIDHNNKAQYRGGSADTIQTLFLYLAKQYDSVTLWHDKGSASTMPLAEKFAIHKEDHDG